MIALYKVSLLHAVCVSFTHFDGEAIVVCLLMQSWILTADQLGTGQRPESHLCALRSGGWKRISPLFVLHWSFCKAYTRDYIWTCVNIPYVKSMPLFFRRGYDRQEANLNSCINCTGTSTEYFRPVRLAYQPPASSTFLSQQTSNQPAVLFSQNKPAPAISHQPTEQVKGVRPVPGHVQPVRPDRASKCKGPQI
jgi:hypothetical protein